MAEQDAAPDALIAREFVSKSVLTTELYNPYVSGAIAAGVPYVLLKMLFITSQELETRKVRGCEERILYEPQLERLTQAKEIVDLITTAFDGVKLDKGIGLFEGQAIDDYAGDQERSSLRLKDEKEDWRSIESKHLNACYSSLSFFDPLGMRFHLPAFICCALRGEYEQGIDISLSDLDDWRKSKFSLLSPQQKSAMAIFLKFLADDADSEFSRTAIERDLKDFWLPANDKAEQGFAPDL